MGARMKQSETAAIATAAPVNSDDLGTRVRACTTTQEVDIVLRAADERARRLEVEKDTAIEMFARAAEEVMRLRRERPWLLACIRALLDRPTNGALHQRACRFLGSLDGTDRSIRRQP